MFEMLVYAMRHTLNSYIAEIVPGGAAVWRERCTLVWSELPLLRSFLEPASACFGTCY